ncbi:MAG TPA: DUF4192 domain-containing protein [Natronosporangium sp.]
MAARPVVPPRIPPTVRLSSPADLIAATPYLLGFHPTDSVVTLGLTSRRLVFAARSDLPGPGDSPDAMATAIIGVVRRQRADTLALIGYGAAESVEPLLRALRQVAALRRLPIKEVLRVEGDRWWSYLCDNPTCCPPEGTKIDLTAEKVSAMLTMEGLTAAPSRAELARRVAPIGGLTRTSMIQATGRAKQRFAQLLAAHPTGDWSRLVLAEGTAAVTAAIQRYAAGGALDDDGLAWLTLLLDAAAVRDAAWRSVTGAPHDLRLWTDATQRADPALAAAPACLLGYAAWQAGDGVLAGLAVERALRVDPGYPLAHLLSRGLRQGVPPAELRDWLGSTQRAGPVRRRRAGQRRRRRAHHGRAGARARGHRA